VTQQNDAEQSASYTVDDASVETAHNGISAADNSEVCDVSAAEPNDVDSQLGDVPLPDNDDRDTQHSEPLSDADHPSIAVTDSNEMPTDAEHCTEESKKDDEVVEVKSETAEQNVEEVSDVRSQNNDEAAATKDDNNDCTNHVVDGDLLVGEICSKDWTTATDDEGSEWSSKRPVIKFDQTDTASAKFDSSALEKILNSLSATSRRDHDEVATSNCTNHTDDDDDEIWMRRDVDDVCQSSLSMLDAAVERLDNGLHFKSKRRRTSTTSSSSSSSVGHCSPSCLMPPSTLDTDTETSTSLFSTCVTKVEPSTDATATLANTTLTNLPLISVNNVEPAEMAKGSQTAG